MCEEMRKLCDYLDSKGIAWDDGSCRGISQIRFLYRRKRWSAINGIGTIGGQYNHLAENRGLLEVWDLCKSHQPIGNLTAEQAIEIMGI